MNLPKVLAAEETQPFTHAKAKSVIFLFLFGGPSQLETFDMKPEAPMEIRGPFSPIKSRTPGLLISDHLPKLANISDKYSVIRTMTHDFNDHSGGGHYIQTGHRWQIPIGGGFLATPNDWPSMGSVVEHLSQHSPGGLKRDLPSFETAMAAIFSANPVSWLEDWWKPAFDLSPCITIAWTVTAGIHTAITTMSKNTSSPLSTKAPAR